MVALQALAVVATMGVAGDSQLYYFSSSWCIPCREMQPRIERVVQAGFDVKKIDFDQHPDAGTRFGVSAVPSLILVQDGRIVDRIDRLATLAEIGKMLQRHGVTPTAKVQRERPSTIRGQTPPGKLAQLSSALAGVVQPNRAEPSPRGTPPRLQLPAADVLPPLPSPSHSQNAVSQGATADALSATVRLTVEDALGQSFGTGTVIDTHGREALVLTCAHIFRESKGKGRIAIDRFDLDNPVSSSGTLISHDLDLDVALVSMRIEQPIGMAKMATGENAARPGDEIFSIGCNHGESPTVVQGRINQIDKYLGPPNITASGRPVDGRSGGGLFNRHGQLIGVCNAADPELDEGLYAALPRVFLELDRNNLSYVHQRATPDSPATPDRTSQPTVSTASFERESHSEAPRLQPMATRAVANEPAQRSHGTELLCILRSPDGTNQVVVVPRPSTQLLGQIQEESSAPRTKCGVESKNKPIARRHRSRACGAKSADDFMVLA